MDWKGGLSSSSRKRGKLVTANKKMKVLKTWPDKLDPEKTLALSWWHAWPGLLGPDPTRYRKESAAFEPNMLLQQNERGLSVHVRKWKKILDTFCREPKRHGGRRTSFGGLNSRTTRTESLPPPLRQKSREFQIRSRSWSRSNPGYSRRGQCRSTQPRTYVIYPTNETNYDPRLSYHTKEATKLVSDRT